jgi:putative serine protease PepD
MVLRAAARTRPSAGRPGAIGPGDPVGILGAVPLDDEPDDAPERGPGRVPLPPEDRLWRHPSELGHAAPAHPATVVVQRRAHSWLVGLLSFGLGAAATLALLAAVGTFDAEPPATAVERVQIEVAKNPNASDLAVAEAVLPAVVRIRGEGVTGTRSGTGVVFRTDGYVLTTADAIDGADAVTVWSHDGRPAPATVVGVDPSTDLAVVKVDPSTYGVTELPAATIGRANALQLGERTVAVVPDETRPGRPTVSVGLVSGLDMRVDGTDGTVLHDMIQSSVRLTPEVTGAPLIDSSGAVVGLITCRDQPAGEKARPSTADDNTLRVRYATPIDYAKAVADELILTGRVAHVWLGVEGTDPTEEEIDREGRGSAVVTKVATSSPAAAAGLRPQDRILAVDGVPVTSMSELVVTLRAHRPGDTVGITFRRGTEEQTTLVSLGERSSAP